LIRGKIVKIVATRCHILKLKCTEFDFGWGSIAPDPAGRAYSALQLHLRGPTPKEREGKKDGKEGQGRGKRGGSGPTSKSRGVGGEMAERRFLALRWAWTPQVPVKCGG